MWIIWTSPTHDLSTTLVFKVAQWLNRFTLYNYLLKTESPIASIFFYASLLSLSITAPWSTGIFILSYRKIYVPKLGSNPYFRNHKELNPVLLWEQHVDVLICSSATPGPFRNSLCTSHLTFLIDLMEQKSEVRVLVQTKGGKTTSLQFPIKAWYCTSGTVPACSIHAHQSVHTKVMVGRNHSLHYSLWQSHSVLGEKKP